MKVLGRNLVDPFSEFWNDIEEDLSISYNEIKSGSEKVFGDQYFDPKTPVRPRWLILPDHDLAYHVAHEITHLLLKSKGFPSVGRGIRYPENSEEARVGSDLEELVVHQSLEWIINKYKFSRDFILETMYEGAKSGLLSTEAPEYGTPWFFTWAIRYAELAITLSASNWEILQDIYTSKSSDIVSLGEELRSLIFQMDPGTIDSVMETLLLCRNLLGLGVDDRLLIIDNRTGDMF